MKFPLRYLTFFILLLFAFTSCRFSGFSARYLSNNAKQARPAVYPADFSKALYKTELSLYGRPLTGITVIKKDTSGYFVALVSEVGLKYFELFFPHDITKEAGVNYIMDVLNHKPVVDGLTDCIGLLFREPVYDKHAHLQMNETGKTCLLTSKYKKGKMKYYYGWMSGEVEQLQFSKMFAARTTAKISGYESGIPGSILIFHGKISILLNRL